MIKQLIKIANKLDEKSLFNDADKIDKIILKSANDNSSLGNVSEIDIRTLKYIRDNYKFTDEGKKIFDERLNELISNNK